MMTVGIPQTVYAKFDFNAQQLGLQFTTTIIGYTSLLVPLVDTLLLITGISTPIPGDLIGGLASGRLRARDVKALSESHLPGIDYEDHLLVS